jgi:hypothetical protein
MNGYHTANLEAVTGKFFQKVTVIFWSVGVEKERETSHNPGCPVGVIFGLRRSLNEKHR